MRPHKAITLSKGNKLYSFNSYKECAKFVGVTPESVSRSIKWNFKIKKYTIWKT